MKCPICRDNFNEENASKWDCPETPEKHGKYRYDSSGKLWCQKCTDDFDSIDWDDVRND